MTQEDKELLLKDLCARLPYGVKVKHEAQDFSSTLLWVDAERLSAGRKADKKGVGSDWGSIEFIKPYLRPMSSMTEDESAELSNIINEWFDKELFYLTEEPFLECALSRINYSISPKLFDWLNANHFDYRGLIPKGLAIEVTEKNNPYKQ